MEFSVIGSCSLCGGDVCGYVGLFAGTPPPASCRRCGAVEARHRGGVIPMMRPEPKPAVTRDLFDQLIEQGQRDRKEFEARTKSMRPNAITPKGHS